MRLLELKNDSMWPRVSGLLVLGALLLVLEGLVGLVLVGVVGLVWLVAPTPYAVAGGQILYTVSIADSGTIAAVGIVSFGILFVPDLVERWTPNAAMVGTVVLVVSTFVFAGSVFIESLWLRALALCLGFGLGAYSIHRYELVRFGKVTLSS